MILELKNLEKRFGKKRILKDISFSFEKGVYGLLAPNGAGKTTLIRCITQLYDADGGSIHYMGKSIDTISDYRSHLGYLSQKFGLFKELTVNEMMSLMALLKGMPEKEVRDEVERCISLVNMQDKSESKVSTLSGGMIRRLGIAQAVLGKPAVILLDEPTAGLDPEERLRFKNIISSLRKEHTVILSTHIVEDIEALCDCVIVMRDGEIASFGTCHEIQEAARGKVYELLQENENSLIGTYHVQRQFERDGRKYLQVLSSEQQGEDKAVCVNPTVEDGYICLLKNI